MLIRELCTRFYQWCDRYRSPATARFYRCRLKRFAQKFGAKDFNKLKPLDIYDFLEEAGEGQSDSTRHHDAVAVTRLQKFALENRILKKPVFDKLEKPPIGRRDRIPTEEETRRLLEHASPAFRLIYEALRASGARPGEFASAQIADYNRAQRLILLKKHKTAKKTGKPRKILVSHPLEKLLERSIGQRTEGPIFLSPNGRPWNTANLSRTYSSLRNAAELPKDLVLYLSRHEFATTVVREKGILVASKLLGHEKITTTQRYEHLLDGDLLKSLDDVAGDAPAPEAIPSPLTEPTDETQPSVLPDAA